ncbi:hypothetical protein, partial [Salmonella enterica]|uniref:hypothetical protein n=1 Tax=Salmonella enterica TaxID=28901 RepID=UPI003D2CF41B
KAYATLQSIYGFASLAAPFFILAFYDYGLKWQNAFFVVGVLSCLINIWSLFVKSEADDPPFPETSMKSLKISKLKVYRFAIFNSLYVMAE